MNLCCRPGCLNEAVWTPVLLLYPALGDDPAEVHMELGVCYGCKARTALSDLMDKESYFGLRRVFETNGLVPPSFERTEVRWEPFLDGDSSSLDLANEAEGRLGEPGY